MHSWWVTRKKEPCKARSYLSGQEKKNKKEGDRTDIKNKKDGRETIQNIQESKNKLERGERKKGKEGI